MSQIIMLFGIFAVHSPESCPLNSEKSKQIFLQMEEKMKDNLEKCNVSKIIGFYMSVLEHEWIIILDGNSAHDIENLCIAAGISSISTVKIVPVNDFSVVIKKLKSQ